MVSGYNYIEYYKDAELTRSARPLIRTILQNVMCLYAGSYMYKYPNTCTCYNELVCVNINIGIIMLTCTYIK